MTCIARELHVNAMSETNIDHAIVMEIASACAQLGDVRYARVKERHTIPPRGREADAKIDLLVSFVLDD